MKRTFTRTMMMSNEEIRIATFKIDLFEGLKYEDNEPMARAEYKGVTAWDIIEGGAEAEEIERHSDIIDEYHEYLVLHFEDGKTGTFRNSHVDMWIR